MPHRSIKSFKFARPKRYPNPYQNKEPATAAINPTKGKINSEGIGGKKFSKKAAKNTPGYPEAMTKSLIKLVNGSKKSSKVASFRLKQCLGVFSLIALGNNNSVYPQSNNLKKNPASCSPPQVEQLILSPTLLGCLSNCPNQRFVWFNSLLCSQKTFCHPFLFKDNTINS